jgi:hypothetical protein
MEKSISELFSAIQYKHVHEKGGYADMVEIKMKEAAERKRIDDEFLLRKRERLEELDKKIEKYIDDAKKERLAHPEKYGPTYWGKNKN